MRTLRFGRFRLRFVRAPGWAWFALALAPTVGYALAEAIIRLRAMRG